MKPTTKELLSLLKDDKSDKLKNTAIKFDDVKFNDNQNLLKIIMKHIFFYNKNTFSKMNLESEKKRFTWVNDLLKSFYAACSLSTDNYVYEYSNGLFSLFYDSITKDYNIFIKELKQKKLKIHDLFVCLLSFLSYLNGNKNNLNIIEEIENNKTINSLCQVYISKKKKSLWQVITDYCIFIKNPIFFSYEDGNNDPKIFDVELSELKCITDMCSISDSYQNFIQTLYVCIKGCKDLRIGREENVQNYLTYIFLLLNIFLANNESWQDSILNNAYEEIFEFAYKYASHDYNVNYIDFVITYVTKYNLTKNDFFHLFLNGLINENFNKTFINIQLEGDMKDINKENVIKELIKRIYEINENDKDIKGSKNNINDDSNKNTDKNKEKLSEILIEKKESQSQENEKSDNNGQINVKESVVKDKEILNENQQEKDSNISTKTMEKSIEKEANKNSIYESIKKELISKFSDEMSVMKNNIIILNKKIQYLNEDNSILREEIQYLNEGNSALREENRKNQINIKKNAENMKSLNNKLEIISFRDLIKKILDNMITYISNRDKNIFNGASKRKEKLKILNENYKYPGIEFMKKPIKDISEKYYDSNEISHVPKIVNILKNLPIGLKGDPAENVAKRFYKIIVESKDSNVFQFMKDNLSLKKEIDSLYFK